MTAPKIPNSKSRAQKGVAQILYDNYGNNAIAQIVFGTAMVALAVAGAVVSRNYPLYVSLCLPGGLAATAAGVLALYISNGKGNDQMKKTALALSIISSAISIGSVVWDIAVIYQGNFVLAAILIVGTGLAIVSAYAAYLQPSKIASSNMCPKCTCPHSTPPATA